MAQRAGRSVLTKATRKLPGDLRVGALHTLRISHETSYTRGLALLARHILYRNIIFLLIIVVEININT